jgi:putative ABC transport system permease protein
MRDYIEGDLMEVYKRRLGTVGKRQADRKFVIDVLLLFRLGIIKPSEEYNYANPYDMLKNYFTVGLRNILKYRVFSFINVFGLAVAMSVCMLIILMLADQYRYDQFHTKKSRIYRILSDFEGSRQSYATSAYPLAKALKTEYSIVEDAVNLSPGVGGDAMYQEKVADMRGYFADPAFFNVFSFELEMGDKATALESPNSMVISKEMANLLFKSENPLGKTIEFSDRQLSFPQQFDGSGSPPVSWGSFTVTGVIDETRYKSHLRFDVLVSASSRDILYAENKLEDQTNNWEWFYRYYTYVLLDAGKAEGDLTVALDDLVSRKYTNLSSETTKGFKLIPQGLADVQLGLMSNDTDSRFPMLGYYFLGFLAIVIMISACLNYTNLSIARALTRAKEIGVRKVTGARRSNLVFQFLSESVLTSFFALTLAVIFLMLLAPAFKGLWVNQYLNFELPAVPSVYLIFVAFALFIGIVAGLYPALFLSNYQPIKALKSLATTSPGKLSMRKALTVFQFVVSLFFITTSILIYNQFKHFLSFDYGFHSQNIVNIDLQGVDYQQLSHELRGIPGVTAISACDIVPSTGSNNNNQLRKIGTDDEYNKVGILITDENFVPNLDIKLIAGKLLPPEGETSDRFILVNEAFARQWEYQFPGQIVGEVFESKWGEEMLEVIGVVKDFRFKLLINEDGIAPLLMRNQPGGFKYLNVKLSTADLVGTITGLENRWKKIDPIHPFRYEFYDDQLQSTHQGLFDVVSILGFIAFLAVVIACLGLLGMATYSAERKTKEVGIRKILGAGDMSIALLLSRGFLKMLWISICIGAPMSYFVNNLWLQKFPNRVEFGIGTVTIGVLVLLVLGFLTIGSQTVKASKTNPVKSLKSE